MNKEELKNFHYTHKNEIQFEYGGRVHHYNMDALKEVFATAWELQERINEAISYISEYCLYDEKSKDFNDDLDYYEIPKLLKILKGGD